MKRRERVLVVLVEDPSSPTGWTCEPELYNRDPEGYRRAERKAEAGRSCGACHRPRRVEVRPGTLSYDDPTEAEPQEKNDGA